MDKMDVEFDNLYDASPPRSRRNSTVSKHQSSPLAPATKSVKFAIPPKPEVPQPQQASMPPPPPPPPPPISTSQPPPPQGSSSFSLLPAIFLPFPTIPTPPAPLFDPASTTLSRADILQHTLHNLELQNSAIKRHQLFLTLQERDRILAIASAEAAAREEKAGDVYTPPVSTEEMERVLARMSAPGESSGRRGEYEHKSAEWIRDPKEREEAAAERARRGEMGRGTAEKVLEVVRQAGLVIGSYEAQSRVVVEGKRRALESELRRTGRWEEWVAKRAPKVTTGVVQGVGREFGERPETFFGTAGDGEEMMGGHEGGKVST